MEYMRNPERIRDRFGLSQGQFFATYQCKNLWWELDGGIFGFGDLTSEDVFRIQRALKEDETFLGWNEHHGTQFQQRKSPMIRIKTDDITFAVDLEAEWIDDGKI